jgi:hypothetical protein
MAPWLPLDDRADQNPAVDRVAVLRARLEQERVVGKLFGWHGVVVVAADAVDARDVAHQLALSDVHCFSEYAGT